MNQLRLAVYSVLGYALIVGVLGLIGPRSVTAQGPKLADPVPVTQTYLQPYQESDFVDIADGRRDGLIELSPVPAGKRLVIEYVTISSSVPPGQNVSGRVGITLESSILGRSHAISMPFQANGSPFGSMDTYVGSERVLMFFDAGETPQILVLRSHTSDGAQAIGSVAGYLVDVR